MIRCRLTITSPLPSDWGAFPFRRPSRTPSPKAASGLSAREFFNTLSAFHGRYRQAGLPLFEAGSTLEVIADDGSSEFAEFYREIERRGVLFGE